MAADNRSLIDLPKLNLESVLMKLPLPSLLVCCCVSMSLLNLIKNDSNFAQMYFAKSESQLMIHSSLHSNFHLIDLDADTSPAFAELVEINPSFNLPLHGFEVTHSCNGLVLLENCNLDDDVHRCMVCNPVTGEYITLPESTVLSRNATCAFFYCPISNQFKIFRAFHRVYRPSPNFESLLDVDPDPEPDPLIELDLSSESTASDGNGVFDSDTHTEDSHSDTDTDTDSDSDTDSNYSESDAMGEFFLGGSDSWESLDNLPFSPLTIYSPCYLDNATHWLCGDESVQNLIVFFHFETVQFGEIPGPAQMTKTHAILPDHVNLVLLDGFLSIFDNYSREAKFDAWKMKEYGVKDSWTREFVIDTTAWGVYGLYYSFKPAICRNNGEVVMVSGNGYIIFHDLLKKRGRIVRHPALELPSTAVAHTPSLMSLRNVIRGSNMVVLNVSPRFSQSDLNSRNYLELSTAFSELETADH
ncbi:hypothetical protein L1987_05083 [Smallanthus sonchifolius]|uniref:Uncharacterized protein n=1 Tax=Smallanthus sonchifolius TaxID=185202 RepID=A0ACB9JUI3_9ASTR|nr:hypothetical protein L1987_05083 [Smallanthus sonchifolius]